MATHPSLLAWRIPSTKEPGGLQYTGSQRVGQDSATEREDDTDINPVVAGVSISFCCVTLQPKYKDLTFFLLLPSRGSLSSSAVSPGAGWCFVSDD